MKRNIERVILVAFVWAVMLGGYWLAGYEFKRCFALACVFFLSWVISGAVLVIESASYEIRKRERERLYTADEVMLLLEKEMKKDGGK